MKIISQRLLSNTLLSNLRCPNCRISGSLCDGSGTLAAASATVGCPEIDKKPREAVPIERKNEAARSPLGEPAVEEPGSVK